MRGSKSAGGASGGIVVGRASREEPFDGRLARSRRTKDAIVDAMRALHAEGNLRPAAPRIAERAGVSLRSVWQQFADMEALLVEAIERDNEILRSLLQPIDPAQPLARRVAAFAGQRARVLEQMTPSWRAARVHEPFSEPLRLNKVRTLAVAKSEVEAVFATELGGLTGRKRRRLLDALHSLSVWSFWESLRADLGLDADRARQQMLSMMAAQLAEAGFR